MNPSTIQSLPLKQTSVYDGEGYFYATEPMGLPCGHSPYCVVWDFNTAQPVGCGLCHLIALFETEFPQRLHEYELLAENGNPETTPRFLSRIESAMGLIPPEPTQNLTQFRASRARAYRQPSRKDSPVTFLLWEMMGRQPKIAKLLVRALLGSEPHEIGREFTLSTYRVHETLGKGTRMALRYLRN